MQPFLTHYQTTNFGLFQTERADDNFTYDENDRLSVRVENTEGKGEIAQYTVFSKDLYCKHVKTSTCLGKG